MRKKWIRLSAITGTALLAAFLSACSAQFDEILRAIDEKIDYICNTNIMAIEKQMQQLAASFEDVSKKTSEMFAGVNGSDVAKLIGAIDKGGVDEQKLVQAFLEQREDYKE